MAKQATSQIMDLLIIAKKRSWTVINNQKADLPKSASIIENEDTMPKIIIPYPRRSPIIKKPLKKLNKINKIGIKL